MVWHENGGKKWLTLYPGDPADQANGENRADL